MRSEDANVDAEAATPLDDLEQHVAFAAIRGRLFGEPGPPVSIGRFLVTRRLGQGGMGVVYAAYDPQLDRKVAVKVLRDVGDDDHAAKARRSLEREARAAAALSHPNVVTVYDSGTVGGGVYVAMELVEGSTLRGWLETPRRWPEVVRMFIAAGRGLQAAHAAGLIHCDFKPDNVLVGDDGRPRVVDFGLVRWMGRSQSSDGSRGPTGPHSAVGPGGSGGTGTIMGGTPAYMPPEQFQGQAEARSDQYAFCVALYRALFGEHPYGVSATLGRVHERGPVPRAVVRAILKGLARAVEGRHASMKVLVDQLERALRWRERLPWAVAGVMVVGVAVGAGSTLAKTVDPCEGAGVEIEALWTDEVKTAVTASLAAAGDPRQAEVLAQRLDDYARGWGEMQEASCVATHVTGEQSGELLELRTACLGRRRNTFEHVVERLRGLAVGQGEAGRLLVEGLPSLAECDGDALRSKLGGRGMAQSTTDRSRSPEVDEAFFEVAELLDRARGEELLGTRGEALALARRAEARAHEVGLRYLEAEAIELRVSLELQTDAGSDAEPALLRALGLAVETDDATGAANVVIRLLSLEQLGAERSLLITLGRALAARSPLAAMLLGRIDLEEAKHAQRQGDHARALELIAHARAGLAEVGLADDTVALKLRVLAGVSLVNVGRLEDAERELVELLSIQRERLSARHVDLADTAFQLASTRLALDEAEGALPLLQEAVSIYRERRGEADPTTLSARQVLARAWAQHGERERAAVELEETIDVVVHTYGASHALSLSPLIDLVELEHEAGELARARMHAMQARSVAIESFGGEHPLVRICGILVAKVVLDLGELELARTLLTEAHGRVDRALAPLAPAEVAHQLARLAMLSVPPDPARARALSDEAIVQTLDVPGESAARMRRTIIAWRRQPHGSPSE